MYDKLFRGFFVPAWITKKVIVPCCDSDEVVQCLCQLEDESVYTYKIKCYSDEPSESYVKMCKNISHIKYSNAFVFGEVFNLDELRIILMSDCVGGILCTNVDFWTNDEYLELRKHFYKNYAVYSVNVVGNICGIWFMRFRNKDEKKHTGMRTTFFIFESTECTTIDYRCDDNRFSALN